MGRPWWAEIWHALYFGHEKANDETIQPFGGDQDQVRVPQVPLLGHGEALEA